MTIQLLYLGDYSVEEEDTLRGFGASLYRMSLADALVPEGFQRSAFAMLRGKKLTVADYRALCKYLQDLGVQSRTTPDAYAALSDSNAYERSIPDLVPRSQAFDLRSPQLLREVVELMPWGRVFIRSELGSAAKQAGLESCFVSTADSAEWAAKIQVLRTTFPNASRLICRAVVPVKKIGEISSEGRFIVVQGHDPYLDHYEVPGQQAKASYEQGARDAAAEVAKRFERNGIVGDFFLDIGEKAAGGWFVVEVKPLFNGTIRDLRTFADFLR